MMDLLGGHPLSMRVLLPELAKHRAAELITAVESNLAALDLGADGSAAKLYATLKFAEEALDAELRPLLVPLALHERYVDGNFLEAMAQQLDPAPARSEIDALLRALASGGLLRELGQAVFEMHPALTGFLRSAVLPRTDIGARDRWARAFVDVFGGLADALAPRQLHEQRVAIHLHGANFLAALEEAARLDMALDSSALLQALGVFAQNQRLLDEAEKQYRKLADLQRMRGEAEPEAVAYHQLGIIAQERRAFDAAEKWYLKALEIKEKLGNERGAASIYHQLGIIAEERRAFDAAEKWYLKSLEIDEKLGNEHGAASTYHQLGIIAEERRAFDAAEKWYLKALEIKEKLGNEHGAASTYGQLGILAEERRAFDAAEKWCLKALEIFEKLGNEHGAASTYGQLGILAGLQQRFEESGRWLVRCVLTFIKVSDLHGAQRNTHNFLIIFRQVPPPEQAKLRSFWEDAGLPWPEDAPGD